ncbi:hypothetical protein [Longispora albida]|uniref:hypothetical protein n=1 Tax=Longispora albida TaxID=203523 RepID=UPI000399CE23|nr:hypothetical protein [Longispora albida]
MTDLTTTSRHGMPAARDEPRWHDWLLIPFASTERLMLLCGVLGVVTGLAYALGYVVLGFDPFG